MLNIIIAYCFVPFIHSSLCIKISNIFSVKCKLVSQFSSNQSGSLTMQFEMPPCKRFKQISDAIHL